MNNKIKNELLQDPAVIEEINKHRWYESEKRGCDVGFEYATDDWLNRYSKSWMRQNVSRTGFSLWFSQLFGRKNS